VGSNKKYRNAYQLFKKSLKLPVSYVEEMCESRYFNHFYTQDEIKQVKSNWSDIDIPS
jgi:hypothetical protein